MNNFVSYIYFNSQIFEIQVFVSAGAGLSCVPWLQTLFSDFTFSDFVNTDYLKLKLKTKAENMCSLKLYFCGNLVKESK